jgi:putative aldouronate transport system substrate-binding protein
MDKRFGKFMTVGLVLLCGALASCQNTTTDSISYPDYPDTPGEKDSWEYLKEADGTVPTYDLDWYVNDSTFSWPGYGNDVISKKITEITGAKINFITPVTDDGQKLSTLISGNALPDLVSVQCWYPQCSQMASQNLLYPVDELMNRWAPSFVPRLEQDLTDYFRQGDGHSYGFPSICFSNKYIADNEKLYPNGGILVREDWYKEASAAGYAMTDPASFIQGCTYIKSKHPSAIPMQLDPFTNEGNKTMTWLAQFFATPYEDANGDYQDTRTDDHYVEALRFLHECNAANLIASSNFSDTYSQIKTNISRGNVFVSLATPQDYLVAWQNCHGNGITYVPLVLRNYEGDAPILQDISGQGYLFTMVSRNCKRPDLVIKLLDYLHSEEGQRLVSMGIEGETWNWTDASKTKIAWTERYKSGATNQNEEDSAWLSGYGINAMTLMMNMSYIFKMKPTDGRKAVDIYLDNLKRPLTPYSYNFKPSFLKHDTASDDYFSISTKAKKIDTKWSEALVNIIRASDYKATYDDALAYAKKQGLDSVIEFYKKDYVSTKEVCGVTYGYPSHQSGYVAPVTGPNGDFSYWIGATHE